MMSKIIGSLLEIAVGTVTLFGTIVVTTIALIGAVVSLLGVGLLLLPFIVLLFLFI